MNNLPIFLSAAWDWSEKNDIPVELWRGDSGDWALTLRLKDGRGWFSGAVYVFPQQKARSASDRRGPACPAESGENYAERVRKALRDCAQKTRLARIKDYTKANPQRQAA